MTFDELVEATGATPANALRYVDPLTTAMARRAIKTPLRKAAFLATVAVESTALSDVEEDLYYKDAARLQAIFPSTFKTVDAARPFVRNPDALSQVRYKGFHGRGLIQLTWEANYQECGNDLGIDFVADPDLLTEPLWAAESAAWFFSTKGCLIPADRGDMRAVTRIVNGPALLHLDRRQALFNQALKVFS